jgi:hypothetical protein
MATTAIIAKSKIGSIVFSLKKIPSMNLSNCKQHSSTAFIAVEYYNLLK